MLNLLGVGLPLQGNLIVFVKSFSTVNGALKMLS
jgi:hypothetical protein